MEEKNFGNFKILVPGEFSHGNYRNNERTGQGPGSIG
jgi:hypothetical protein